MSKSKILLQLDSDTHPSVFDAVVAIDAGVDQLLQYHAVQPQQVRDLVYGLMFTRGPDKLKNSAVFVGGSKVAEGEALLREVTDSFFGPMRVSVMLDANGANTTAAAAVVAAGRHLDLSSISALVLAATGPVGQRVSRLLAGAGARVRVASRTRDRAAQLCETITSDIPGAKLSPCETSAPQHVGEALGGVQLVIAAGAAGVQLLSHSVREQAGDLQVAIDLNAVPPLGIEGIQVTDKAIEYGNLICYGAIGVGGTKMKIHKAALRRIFSKNDYVLDVDAIYGIGKELEAEA